MELPFETWKRLTGKQWPGGKSRQITDILEYFKVGYVPGTAEANLCLQGIMLCGSVAYEVFEPVRNLFK